MFQLTLKERKVLLFIGVLILAGALLRSFKVSAPPPAVTAQAGQEGPVNLNRASPGELEQLPGVGPKTAQAIADWRARYGPFTSLEDLEKVKGIGPKKVQALRGRVVF